MIKNIWTKKKHIGLKINRFFETFLTYCEITWPFENNWVSLSRTFRRSGRLGLCNIPDLIIL